MTYKTLFLYGVILCFVGCSASMFRVYSLAPVDAYTVHNDSPVIPSDAEWVAIHQRDSLNEVVLNDYNKQDSIFNSHNF